MKLSFSLSSKPQTTLKRPPPPAASTTGVEVQESNSREYVTEFDPSKAPTEQSKNRVIPPKSNEWRSQKKMRNLELPLQSDEPTLQFEVDSSSSVDASSNSMSYGLNLRIDSSNGDVSDGGAELNHASAVADPLLQKLRYDLRRLPDESGIDEFTDMPVEEFGRALLSGYGWREGMGIGRRAKEDVKAFEYKKRTGKEGLGFTGELPKLPPKSDRANGNRDDSKEKISEREGERGTIEGKREQKGLYVGKDVRIIGGKEIGMKGRVVEVKHGKEYAVLRLSITSEEVRVQCSDIADIGSSEEERCLRKLKELSTKEKTQVIDRKTCKDKDRYKDSADGKKRDGRDEGMKDRRKESGRDRDYKKGSGEVPWLTSHIRVRIISKELKGGKLYLKKGEIVDVLGPTTCDISMDESKELVQGVDQLMLETALPKRGGPVLVLYGRHKGVYGSLVERDLEKETGVVRDADSHELLNVRLEQISEYIGDPCYIGY